MWEFGTGSARLVVEAASAQDGEVRRARARDTILGQTCVLWWASAGSVAAGRLTRNADVLDDLEHPGLAPLLFRFEGGLPGVDESGLGYAVARPSAARLAEALAEAPVLQRLAALAEVLEVLRYVHARGEAHPGLGPDSLAWIDGHVRVLWGRARSPWIPEEVPSPAHDLAAVRALAETLLTGQQAPAPGILAALVGPDQPESAAAALDLLARANVEVPPRMGAPPFAGATSRVDAVLDALRQASRPVLLVGPPGSGRTRLARKTLGRLAAEGTQTVDLSRATAPTLALHRLVLSTHHPPTFDEAWAKAVQRALLEEPWTGAVYVGRLDGLPGHEAAVLRPLLEPLARAGVLVIAAADAPLPGTLVLPVEPLDVLATEAIVTFVGEEPGAWLGALRRRTRGRPGALATEGAPPRGRTAQALRQLATLPRGVPARMVPALPAALRGALPALARAGQVRFDQDGALLVNGSEGVTGLDEGLAEALRPALLDPLGETDPLWRAVMWVRLGDAERATTLLPDASAHAAGREDLLAEVCRYLARRGDPRAVRTMAELELAAGRPYRALAALRGLPASDVAGAVLGARALTRTGRPRDALEKLFAAEGEETGSWWIARADALLALADLVGAQQALARAGTAPRGASPRARLALRARIALAHLRRGEAPVDLAGLFTELNELGAVPVGLRVYVARILLHLGEASQAVEVLADAANASEESGAALLAAVIRLTLGRAALRLGQEAEARTALYEALAAARFTGAASLERRARYRLALLELERSDLEAAMAHRQALAAIGGEATPREGAMAAVLGARIDLVAGEPAAALRELDGMPPGSLEADLALEHALARAQALLETDRPTEARQLVDATPLPGDPMRARRLLALRGRTHLALGRRYLEEARQRLPDTPRPSERQNMGEVLLAWGGEDVDPEMFPRRLRALERAGRLLAGAASGQAERLHRRLAEAPDEERPADRPTVPAEPREVLGVLLGDEQEAGNIETTLALLDPERNNNLLLTGPTGAGKRVFAEHVARERLGLDGLEEVVLRRTDPQMLVSQLVGTRRGEFTGAVDQQGAIQRAIRGHRALLLDELHTLDRVGQEILLPLLELPQRRFGGLLRSSRELEGPLQILLATNVEVSGTRWRERFRTDLWYRMSQLHVHLPPLANRGTEAIYRYLARMLGEEGFEDVEQALEHPAVYSLLAHPWEGNLRELHAVVRRVARLRRHLGRRLGVEDLPRVAVGEEVPSIAPFGTRDVLESLELNTVIEALRRCDWNQTAAAERLAISKYRLHRILQKHDLLDWVRERRDTPDSASDAD